MHQARWHPARLQSDYALPTPAGRCPGADRTLGASSCWDVPRARKAPRPAALKWARWRRSVVRRLRLGPPRLRARPRSLTRPSASQARVCAVRSSGRSLELC